MEFISQIRIKQIRHNNIALFNKEKTQGHQLLHMSSISAAPWPVVRHYSQGHLGDTVVRDVER